MPNAPNPFSWLPYLPGVLGNNSPSDALGGSAVEAMRKITRAWFAERMKTARRNRIKMQQYIQGGRNGRVGLDL